VPKTILIVDDDPEARHLYGAALRDRGFHVVTALHGAEGVHLGRRHRPDLILMDIRMPVMSGWDAVRYLKTDPMTANIPIWLISAYAAEEDAEDPDRLGVDRVLAKPIEPREIVAAVEARIGPPLPPTVPGSGPRPE
jgi:two-component system, OmpR family, alkaline phosphatase synthesis response regulator PhoP